MDTADTSPLLADDSTDEDISSSKELKNLVFFHGMELSNKSFLHSPKPSTVRIGVGKEGIYKLDSKGNKVLSLWRYSDIKDWTYSGYSFSLQLRNGGGYSVRTDDGESICSYVEAFQQDPTTALQRALANPPNSRLPEVGSGIRSLMRKFSGDSSVPLPEPRFYTLNRRTSKKNPNDPTSKLSHNIEVDSRLRTAYSQGKPYSPLEKRNRSISNPEPPENGLLKEQDNKQESKNTEEDSKGEKRFSNGFVMSPISTKGEPTRDAMTQQGVSGSLPKSNPPLLRKRKAPVYMPKEETSVEERMETNRLSPPAISESSNSTNQIGESGSHDPLKAPSSNQTPPNLCEESPQPTNQIAAEQSSRPRELSPSDSDASNDTAPLLRPQSSSSSSGLFSPTSDDFQFVPIGQSQKERRQSSSSEGSHYDSLEKIREVIATRKQDSIESLSRSASESSTKGETPLRARIQSTENAPFSPLSLTINEPSERRFSSSSDSSIYDHLSPLSKEPEIRSSRESPPKVVKNIPTIQLLPTPFDSPVRRNVSQPALSTPTSTRTTPSPCPSLETGLSPLFFDQFGSDFEEDETPINSGDDVKEETPELGGKVDLSGVVLRQKKIRSQTDPFAALLGSPVSVSRLRWSQELNPLYDFMKGVKTSQSMVAQDIRLYDVGTAAPKDASVDSEATPKKSKTPSVIIEESEQSETESEVVSPTEFQPSDEFQMVHQQRAGNQEPEKLYLTAASCTLPRTKASHTYEDINLLRQKPVPPPRPRSGEVTEKDKESLKREKSKLDRERKRQDIEEFTAELKSATLASLNVGRLRSWETKTGEIGPSPRLGKRQLQQRRSRTIASMDDTEALKRKQRPTTVKGPDNLKDFSYVMREFRLFYIKMPNGVLHREVYNINRPVGELRERLCDYLGVDNPENYLLYVEGAVLTTQKEADAVGDVTHVKLNKATSLTQLFDSSPLPDQGTDPILLKPNLSLRMQGISTSRILSLMSDDEVAESTIYPSELPTDVTDDFHRDWVSVVQGNLPCTQEVAVKLGSLQYQAYFLDRTAVHSVVGFCRPTEFLPVEYANVRGIEQKLYKEQETLKKLRTHKEIHETYTSHYSKLSTHDTIFFPAREPRKKLLQSTKLKPVLLGVSSRGIMRVDPKTKEVLDMWEFQVLKNWAYSRKTFVVAFANKNYPVECNQAKWVSDLVDFHVDSIVNSPRVLAQIISTSSEETAS